MKILHIISSLDLGGAQKLVSDLLPEMANHADVDIKLVVCRLTNSMLEQHLIESGIKIISLDTPERSVSLISKLRPLIKEADLVHAHLFPINYIVALANISISRPLVFTEHSTHNRRRDHNLLRQVERWMYSRYSKIGCISHATATNLSEWIGESLSLTRLRIIENGINLNAFERGEKIAVKNIFGRDGKPMLMVSRFVPAKDQATVIRALPYVSNQDIFIAFAGDGETLENMKSLAKDLGVDERVIFLGNRNDIPNLIKSAWIGIQSSHWEGFGLTAVEMMAGGLPVIASDVEGLRQVVESVGEIFPHGNHKVLATIINNLDHNTGASDKMIEKGKERSQEFSIRRTATRYLNLYKEILENS
jgi:glycosyltransferase involved in cell wall biosynthesis